MAERHIKGDIPAYLSNTLPESRRREVENHSTECERCRHILDKARAKLSRKRRDALKAALPGGPTNLFLNRLVKQEGVEPPSSGAPWMWLLLIVFVAAGVYWLSRHQGHWSHATPVLPVALPMAMSSGTVATLDKPLSPASRPAVPAAKPSARTEVSQSTPVATQTEAPPETPRTWSGSECAIKDERQVVVKGRSAWRALWQEMGESEATPRVNFNAMLVIGIFAGEKPSTGYTVQLKEPQDDADSLVVAYTVEASSPSTATPTASHPYTLRTIPRGSKPVRFLEETSLSTNAVKETR